MENLVKAEKLVLSWTFRACLAGHFLALGHIRNATCILLKREYSGPFLSWPLWWENF